MYACNNCGEHTLVSGGRCATCNMRLHSANVTPISDLQALDTPADIAVSHRCGNCGEPVVNEGGKCRACRFPIPSSQLGHVPEAAILPLKGRSKDADLLRAS